MRMFFDTEFTGLHKETELLSLGMFIDNDEGKTLKEIYLSNIFLETILFNQSERDLCIIFRG